jgi:vitamin B12 transporter
MALAKTFLISFIAQAGLCAASALHAADLAAPTSEFNEVVVTASRIEQPLAQVGVSVDVLTAEDLKQRNNASLADILRTVPGINVSNSGGLGKATSVFIRGEDAFRTRLYIDGIAINDTTATQISPRFDALLNQQLGRVEILKGPQALMYGADSGGVISVFTPEAIKSMEGDLALEAGSFHTQNVSANLRGTGDFADYFISAGVVDTDGFSTRKDDPSQDNDGFRAANIHSKIRMNISDEQSIGLVGRFNRSANEYDGCYGPSGSVNSCDDQSKSSAGRVDWRYHSEQFEQEFALAHYQNQHDRYLAADMEKNESLSGASDEAQYFGHYQFNAQVGASLGLTGKRETFVQKKEEGGYKADEMRESYGVFSEWLIHPTDEFSYRFGARWDTNPDFGSHTSYRLAGAYVIPTAGPELKWRAATSTGFRLPSFYEIYFNNHAAYDLAGTQKDFTNEASRGMETGLDASWKTLALSATLFSNKIQDEIFYDSLNYSGYVQVKGESSSQGVELSGQWQMSAQVQWRLAYTHLETEQNSSELAGTNAKLEKVQRPENSYSAGVHIELCAAAWLTDINYRSAFNQRAYGGKLMEDYTVVDAQTAWQFNPALRAHLRVVNALEENYQEVQGYNTAPLSAYAGVSLSF